MHCKGFSIIGGGVMGLSIAYQLLKQQQQVTIFHTPKSTTASLAAGGMLGAQNEFHAPSPLYPIALESRALHPVIAQELYDLTQLQIDWLPTSLMKVATSQQAVPQLKNQFHFLASQDATSIDWLDGQQTRQLEPFLHDEIAASVHIHQDYQVNARKLMTALWQAVKQLGATIIEDEVLAFEHHQKKITHVHTTTTRYAIEHVVVATGAFTTALLSSLALRCPMHAVKGECVMVKSDKPLKHTIFTTDGYYLVPKCHQQILIGATSYPFQQDDIVTVSGVQRLLSKAMAIMPALKDAHILDSWCGVRPQTMDSLPIMGASPYINLSLCTGHYRNGILLSAITGQLFSQYLLGDKTAKQRLEPFQFARFSS